MDEGGNVYERILCPQVAFQYVLDAEDCVVRCCATSPVDVGEFELRPRSVSKPYLISHNVQRLIPISFLVGSPGMTP